jgi:membrane protein implicated in regulation of membrane protease activity
VVEGLGLVVILAFVTLIFAIIQGYFQIIVPQILLLVVVAYLLIRVRVKIAKAEKEKLKTRIDELEGKIKKLAGDTG